MGRSFYLHPNFELAERLYPEVLKELQQYEDFVDTYGDEEGVVYKEMKERLSKLTNKDLSSYSLYESWEEEGIEVLSFKIVLPAPLKVDGITKEELSAIIYQLQNLQVYDEPWECLSFAQRFEIYTDDFYHRFLKLNFKFYNYQQFFGKQRNGRWLTELEIVDRLLIEHK